MMTSSARSVMGTAHGRDDVVRGVVEGHQRPASRVLLPSVVSVGCPVRARAGFGGSPRPFRLKGAHRPVGTPFALIDASSARLSSERASSGGSTRLSRWTAWNATQRKGGVSACVA